MVTCKITKPNKRVKHYLTYLDQSLTGPLYHNELKELELKIPEDGQSICMDIDEKMADLIFERVSAHAYSKAISLLATAEYSQQEIRYKLQFRNYSQEVIDQVIHVLYEMHALDDRRYAEAYIRAYIRKKSRDLIEKELDLKNLSGFDFDSLYHQVSDDEGVSEEDALRKIFDKKYKDTDFSDEKLRNRCLRYFASKGFMASDIMRLIRERLT